MLILPPTSSATVPRMTRGGNTTPMMTRAKLATNAMRRQ
jgi:hypothetical protein